MVFHEKIIFCEIKQNVYLQKIFCIYSKFSISFVYIKRNYEHIILFFRSMDNLFNRLLSCLCIADISFLASNLLVLPFHFGYEVMKNKQNYEAISVCITRIIVAFGIGVWFSLVWSTFQSNRLEYSHDPMKRKKEGWIVNDPFRHLICTKWLMQQCMQHKGIIKYIKISHQWLLSFKYIEVTFSMKFWHLKVKLNMQRHQELKGTNTPRKKPALNWFVW